MKHFFLSFFLLAVSFITEAQINISLTANPRPVANISSWGTRRDVLSLVATVPTPGGSRIVKINTTITTTSGEVVATTDMLRAPVRTLVAGNNIFYAADVVNLSVMIFSNSYLDKINKTSKLPVGSYQITVRLDSPDLPVPLSNTASRIFFLAGTQLPVLMLPVNESVLPTASAQTAITFRWTSIAPKPIETVRYRVQVFEVLENQNPMQALRSNQPLLDKEVLGVTQFIWQPQLSFIEGDKKFVWTIQSFDFQQQLITGDVANGEGRSEAITFTVSTGKSTPKINE